MDREALRRFARRDWSALADARRDYWAEQYRTRGPAAASRASLLLLEHARHVQPGFPSEADRSADLASHVETCDRLDRAARAFADR
ncbi:MAG: hypothetical protein AB7Q16_20875 [Vicinamibacterales bacterium]